MSRFFVTCARGVEELTAKELSELGSPKTEIAPGGVYFEGDQDILYKAHLWLRTGNRIFLPLRSFSCRNPDDLYENLSKFKWETFLSGDKTFAVDCTLSGQINPALNHSHYAKLKAKDAIVDRMRERTGDRPNVDIENPDISIVLYVRDGVCSLNMDATGRSLHERGYRSKEAEAPLKETLAAAILLLSDWNPSTPILDPMCGSGTLLAEAALIASKTAPGLFRKKFLFMNWPDYYEPRWKKCVEEAKSAQVSIDGIQFYGFDKSRRAIDQTRQAFETIGLHKNIFLAQKAFEDFSLPDNISNGTLVVNPPYGERLGDVEDLKALYKLMGDTFKQKLKGWNAAVFTGDMDLAKSIGLRAKRRIPLFNGAIDSRLLTFEMYEGSRP